MFQFPSDFTAQVGSNATSVIATLSPFVTMILGVLLAVFAIGAIISWIKH